MKIDKKKIKKLMVGKHETKKKIMIEKYENK